MRRPGTENPFAVHRAWIGLVQPDGIVVSPAALVDAGLMPDPLGQGEHDALRRLCGLPARDPRDRELPEAPRFLVTEALPRFVTDVLGCPADWLRGTTAHPFDATDGGLSRVLPEFNAEVLAPSYALRNPNTAARHAKTPWLCLLHELPAGWDLDLPHGEHTDAHWRASPMAKFERLLRETDVPVGVIANDRELRVVYAPPGEGAGVMAFPLALLLGPDGDAALGALVMLLGYARWLDASPDGASSGALDKQHLPRVLAESRRYQNNVSTQLSGQVLDALWDLLRGLQVAHVQSHGALLRDWINDRPEEIYGALLAVLLRLVFLLYAEDREQLPTAGFYPASYGVRTLYEKLRDDAGHHPDTMDLRHGAWQRLLATFRLVHGGGGHGEVHLPPREGALFSPDTHPLLEGRPRAGTFPPREALDTPAVSDGVVLRVLEKLLRVDREDLSYKTLGVEELGSVYESIMGFTVETTAGRSLALEPDDVVVDLDALAKVPGAEREKWLKARAGVRLSGKGAAEAVRAAATVDALAEALTKHRSRRTPDVLPPGTLVLQPTEERRRSGSHYTPRSLTTPIVEKTLAPVLAALGEHPTHAQLLALKVCDPAMGSGAFLVAACRALGDRLYAAWQRPGGRPREVARVSPDDDERVVARRLVAQHCLYGVDKNPFAVDLARLSLWLETLAKEHPFTFLDHALRDGDSLVGVSRAQVEALSLDAVEGKGKKGQLSFLEKLVRDGVELAVDRRAGIRALALSDDTGEKRRLLDEANAALTEARAAGDALVATFFAGANATERKKRAKALVTELGEIPTPEARRRVFEAAREGLTLKPLHWELEFPEVFARENGGFDVVVGNPPFMGGMTITTHLGETYTEFLIEHNEESGNRADLSAYFVRRAFSLLRTSGTFGLIATNTVAQGDTRGAGLRWICRHGGTIFDATRRVKWPGLAAVVVSVICVYKGAFEMGARLDGMPVARVSAFLQPGTVDEDPQALEANAGIAHEGIKPGGKGFLFEDGSEDATPIAVMEEILRRDPDASTCVFPYIGGEDLNSSPTQDHSRYIIHFGDRSVEEAARFSGLLEIVARKVKPERQAVKREQYRRLWWLLAERQPSMTRAIAPLRRVLVNSQVSSHLAFAFQPKGRVYGNVLNVFAFDDGDAAFAVMQSRVHEVWARFFASTLEDRLRYVPSDCFETFPFPEAWQTNAALEDIGRRYYEARAARMVRDEGDRFGLTELYNRFHDPRCEDEGIVALRGLHAEMDRAVLDAYGWGELAVTHAFVDDHAEEGEAEDEGSGKRRRSVRWRWPDAVRDEVLARLIALNATRAAAEAAARAEKEAAAKAAKTDAKVRQGVLRLVAPQRETVAEAFRAHLAQRGITAEVYGAERGIGAAELAQLSASALAFDPNDLSNISFAMVKAGGGDDRAYYEALSEIERQRRKPSRAKPLARAARTKKGSIDEP